MYYSPVVEVNPTHLQSSPLNGSLPAWHHERRAEGAARQSEAVFISEAQLAEIDLNEHKSTVLIAISRSRTELERALISSMPRCSASVMTSTSALRCDLAFPRALRQLIPALPRSALEDWTNDLKKQATLVAYLEGASRVRLTAEIIPPSDRALPNPEHGFHIDRVSRRALCSYVGPGTEWVSRKDCVESELDLYLYTRRSIPNQPRAFLRPETIIHSLPRDCFAIARGDQWVHRRPLTAEYRVFTAIDPE